MTERALDAFRITSAVLLMLAMAPAGVAQEAPAGVAQAAPAGVAREAPAEMDQEAQEIHWMSFEDALPVAAANDRPIFVYVRAPWCTLCYRLEKTELPALTDALQQVIPVKIDLADRPAPGDVRRSRLYDWVRRMGLETPPAFAVVTPNGSPAAILRGFTPAEGLRLLLSHSASPLD